MDRSRNPCRASTCNWIENMPGAPDAFAAAAGFGPAESASAGSQILHQEPEPAFEYTR
jgi:hypothetical protein